MDIPAKVKRRLLGLTLGRELTLDGSDNGSGDRHGFGDGPASVGHDGFNFAAAIGGAGHYHIGDGEGYGAGDGFGYDDPGDGYGDGAGYGAGSGRN